MRTIREKKETKAEREIQEKRLGEKGRREDEDRKER